MPADQNSAISALSAVIKKSVFICVHPWLIFIRLSRRSLGEGGCLGAFVAETQSIKNNNLCKTKPI